ncbi:MAG: NAD(P)/FAD-dependent oxidoreductase [Ignavibacteriae bacterium]|nr:NAD(P)/FAD-dependent oxidoreductase [Ignavibacteriota bacterium]
MTMTNKTILILGGGIGGIVTARELRRHLGAQHRIIIVDKSAIHSFPPSYLWVMLGWRKPSAIQKPLSLLEKHGIEFHHAAVHEIDPERKVVRTDRTILNYDYLVVTLGAELTAKAVPGLAETSHSFYTLEQAETLSRLIPQFSEGKIAILIAGAPYKCPPAPYEAALLLESYFSRRGTNGVEIQLFTPEPSPLAVAGPDAGMMLRKILEQRGIVVETKKKIASVDASNKQLMFEDGSSARFDLLIAIPPHRVPEVVRAAHLVDESGWIPVDEHTLRTHYPDVYALGDVTTIALPNGFALPKAGVFAAGQAEVVALNIARELHNGGASKEFKGHGFCFLETGNGRAGYINGNFYTKPSPTVTFHEPSVTYHWGKVVFEKYWLWRWF